MTVTPAPPPSDPGANEPPQNQHVIKLTRGNLILGAIVAIGLVMSAVAIWLAADRPPQPTSFTNDEARMYDLGTQWAQGYVEALKFGNPDQNVLNSLYGACVLYTDSRIVPQYGNTLAPSWLRGCLNYTRDAQVSATNTTPSTN